MLKKPRAIDFCLLACFTLIITFQPYYLHGTLNLYELGLYLPSIQATLDGLIPYRDFFHLRGPFEFYMPAFAMSLFGEEVGVLMSFFYVGTVITLVLFLLTAKTFYQTRLVYYLMVPVLVAKTFPRVVFTYWGGMRFALGILAIFCLVQYLKQEKRRWIFGAGIVSSCAFFTSIEIGVCAMAGALGTLLLIFVLQPDQRKRVLSGGGCYVFGMLAIIVPYFTYLFINQSLTSYLDATQTVVFNMQKTFPVQLTAKTPKTFFEALWAMMIPGSKNFKYMTPAYLYVFYVGFVFYKIRKKTMERFLWLSIPVAIYGFVMYVLAFRNIEGAQFEMALQPEKILLFFLLERTYFFLKERQKSFLIGFFIFILVGSSLGYSIQRYNHRFFAWKFMKSTLLGKFIESLDPLAEQESIAFADAPLSRLKVPEQQATDILQLQEYVQKNTESTDALFMMHDLGIYHFILDRPFVGKFPIDSFSWMKDIWHEQWMERLYEVQPKVAVLMKEPGWWFEDIYFIVPENRQKYQKQLNFVKNYYDLDAETPSLLIYRRK